jgi:hypothetical protein
MIESAYQKDKLRREYAKLNIGDLLVGLMMVSALAMTVFMR